MSTVKQAPDLKQTGQLLDQLEAKVKYQWSLVTQANSVDELSVRRARALETYAQLNKYKVQIGLK